MELCERVVNYTGMDIFTLYLTGDTHYGTIHHDRKRWLNDVDTIKNDPHALWLHVGDAVEAIVLTDPRFKGSEIAPEFRDRLDDLPHAQIEQFCRDAEPIRDKCIGLLEGNHENEYTRRHYGRLTEKAAEWLGVPFLSDTCLIRLMFRHTSTEGERNRTFVTTIYAEHGSGGGRKKGAKVNNLEDLSAFFDADIYARGHVHTKMIWEGCRLGIPHKGALKLLDKTPLFALTGSYYRGYEVGSTSYAQQKGLPPSALGCERVLIQPLKERVYKP
jgi:hypothetical protein